LYFTGLMPLLLLNVHC